MLYANSKFDVMCYNYLKVTRRFYSYQFQILNPKSNKCKDG